jgi:hypothetical protein
MKSHLFRVPRGLVALILAVPSIAASAAGGIHYFDEPCADCAALSDAALDKARGGLVLEDNLLVTFGLERSLLVNGELASATTLNTSFTTGGLGEIDLQRSVSNIVQIGDNNQLAAAAFESLRGGLGTLIQNSADQQVIQTLTTIDIVVRNVDFLSSSPMLQNGTLYEIVLDAARP